MPPQANLLKLAVESNQLARIISAPPGSSGASTGATNCFRKVAVSAGYGRVLTHCNAMDEYDRHAYLPGLKLRPMSPLPRPLLTSGTRQCAPTVVRLYRLE